MMKKAGLTLLSYHRFVLFTTAYTVAFIGVYLIIGYGVQEVFDYYRVPDDFNILKKILIAVPFLFLVFKFSVKNIKLYDKEIIKLKKSVIFSKKEKYAIFFCLAALIAITIFILYVVFNLMKSIFLQEYLILMTSISVIIFCISVFYSEILSKKIK